MKQIVALNRPTLKTVKVNDIERHVIEAKIIMPYTREAWAFMGQRAGEALNAEFASAQREMFDPETGEVTS